MDAIQRSATECARSTKRLQRISTCAQRSRALMRRAPICDSRVRPSIRPSMQRSQQAALAAAKRPSRVFRADDYQQLRRRPASGLRGRSVGTVGVRTHRGGGDLLATRYSAETVRTLWRRKWHRRTSRCSALTRSFKYRAHTEVARGQRQSTEAALRRWIDQRVRAPGWQTPSAPLSRHRYRRSSARSRRPKRRLLCWLDAARARVYAEDRARRRPDDDADRP